MVTLMAGPFHNTFMADIEQQTREEGYFLVLRSEANSLELEHGRDDLYWPVPGRFFRERPQDRLPFVLVNSYIDLPRGKSIVGFDDNCLCRLTHPQLATIRQNAEQKGVLATKTLLGQLRRQNIDRRQIILPVRLVERESVRSIEGDRSS